jgi:hypothetical protein
VRVAFVSSAGIERGRSDDAEAADRLGAELCVWDDQTVDWARFDRVIVRSVWDYTADVDHFLAWCDRVGPERLRNRPELIRFNADKRYLQALDVPTVPTRFLGPGEPVGPLTGEVVIKPNVSAGARDTGRFGPAEHGGARALIAAIQASGRWALIQPFLPLIAERGETAIVYLGGAPSHVLTKRLVLETSGVAPLGAGAHAPAAAMLAEDLVCAGVASEAELRLAAAVHAQISARYGTPLYARIDLVPGLDGEPRLLELELIEPCLYLRLAPGASARFAAAIQADAVRPGPGSARQSRAAHG